jgi:hypothetical protein
VALHAPAAADGLARRVVESPGEPLDPAARASLERSLGHDFSAVRVHADAAAAESASILHASAFAHGSHVVFGAGRYAPHTESGRRLLAHELAHVVQQANGSPGSAAAREREAEAAGREPSPLVRPGPRSAAIEPAPLRATPPAPAPVVQLQTDRAAVEARLKAVRARLAALRAEEQRFGDEFAESRLTEQQRASDARARAQLEAQARSDMAAAGLWGGSLAGARIRRAAAAAVSGDTVTVTARIRIAYLALSDREGERQAAIDIPRIEAAIRDVWRVDIASGEYAGMKFRLVPRVSYLKKGAPAPTDDFLIQVRAPDTGPSSGDAVSGVISLAPVHLQGSRVIVVAHELAHLFGFTDAYLTMTTRDKRRRPVEQWTVARPDPANRPDLLGLIDPEKLRQLEAKGAVSAQDVKRQTGAVRVWEEEASVVLRVLGVAPPPPRRPGPDSEDFDPADELQRLQREKEAQLAEIRRRTQRVEGVRQSLDRVEEIIRLEREEAELARRLAPAPAAP